MLRKDKEVIVAEAVELLAAAETLFVSDYRGLSVAELTELRGKLRESGARVKVLKNTLTRRAAAEARRDDIAPLLSGPTAITFCGDDPVGPAKALIEFARTHPAFAVRGGFLQGALIDEGSVQSLSALPPRDILLGQVVGTMAAPMTGLVTVLQATISGFVRSLQQIAEQKAAAGEA